MLTYPRKRTLEYAAVEDFYSPTLHRVNQVVRHRAIYGKDAGIPPIMPILLKYSHPPEDLVKKCRPVLEDLIETAAVKEGSWRFSISSIFSLLTSLQCHRKPKPVKSTRPSRSQAWTLMHFSGRIASEGSSIITMLSPSSCRWCNIPRTLRASRRP